MMQTSKIACLSIVSVIGFSLVATSRSTAGNDSARQVIKVTTVGFVAFKMDFKGSAPSSEPTPATQTLNTEWIAPEGVRTESDFGMVTVAPAGEKYMYSLDTKHKVALRFPVSPGEAPVASLDVIATPPGQHLMAARDDHYLGYPCRVTTTEIDWFGHPSTTERWDALFHGYPVTLLLSTWSDHRVLMFSSAVTVDEHATLPADAFRVPNDYKVVPGPGS